MLDAMSGLWCCSLGYSQPSIAEAVNRQFQELPYYNNFFSAATPQPSNWRIVWCA
jgi:putrescine aminotransferase